ncbi:MAG: MFS transporter [Alphaproteobacteria bacterium]
MTAVQAMVSLVVIMVPVFAVAAPDIGVDARIVGFYSALVYTVSTLSAPIGGQLTDRIGPVRTSQICMLVVAVGIALVATAWLPLVALGAMLMGAGNGPATPASTYILSRRTPPRLMSLVLSIKQTGAALGIAIAGATVPFMVVAMGWQGAALVGAGISLVVAVALEALRKDMDRDVHAAHGSGVAKRPSALAGLGLILRNRRLAVMAACSFSFCVFQIAVTSYFVTFLVEEIGIDKAKAAYLFSIAVTVGAAVRVAVGALADWLGDRSGVLAALGLGMGACAVWFMFLTRGTAIWEIAVLGVVFACVSMTWTGVFLAEIMPFVPQQQTGGVTGAVMIFFYAGSVVGPGLFGVILTATGSYSSAFAAVGVPAFLSGGAFLVLRRRGRSGPSSPASA